MDEDRFNMAVRQFLKVVGVTSQREIERIVREGKIEGTKLKLRITLTAENRHSITSSKRRSTFVDRTGPRRHASHHP
jgi:Family of unknown function (DUF6494)